MRQRAFTSLLLVGLAASVLACSGPNIVLATLPEGGDAEQSCTSDADAGAACPIGWYCDKPTCDAPSGTCRPRPTTCDEGELPVCGCDGVTYFDDCLRRANGIASMTPTPCQPGSARTCGEQPEASCPPGSLCAEFVGPGPGSCQMPPYGICWAIPAPCPAPGPGGGRLDSCSTMQRCIDTCSAIRQGGVYHHSMMCP